MAYVEQASDYSTGDVITATEYNQLLDNIIYNHDYSRPFRNRLINGNFIVDQYSSGPFSSTLTAATEEYVIDRWYAEATGGTPAGAQVAGTGNRQFHYQFTGAASVSALKFGQRIEAANIQDQAGETVTISVYLANSVLTSVGWAVTYADSEDDFSSVTAIDSGSWTVDGTMTQYTAEVDLPANAANGIQLELSVGAQTSGTWTVGNVQLEPGDTATEFDVREVGTELAMCLRRGRVVDYETTGSRFGLGFHDTASSFRGFLYFNVEMASIPTLVAASGTNYWNMYRNGGVAAANSISLSAATRSMCEIEASGGGTAGHAGTVFLNPAAWAFLTCEL